MEAVHTGMRWGEGPVWFADGQLLLFVDIPRSQILRWIEDQPVSALRSPSNHANGNTRRFPRDDRAFVQKLMIERGLSDARKS